MCCLCCLPCPRAPSPSSPATTSPSYSTCLLSCMHACMGCRSCMPGSDCLCVVQANRALRDRFSQWEPFYQLIETKLTFSPQFFHPSRDQPRRPLRLPCLRKTHVRQVAAPTWEWFRAHFGGVKSPAGERPSPILAKIGDGRSPIWERPLGLRVRPLGVSTLPMSF